MRDEFYHFIKGKDLPQIKDSIKDDLLDDEDIDGYKATQEIIPSIRKDSVTSIICATDKLAQGTMRALQESGFSIPDDISVIGLGNLEFGKYLSPPLTTVDQCEEEKGREGINIVTDSYKRRAIIKVPVRLVERNSTSG
jgi:DNA-binding LacI/PurR family transcriptional regulator